MDFVSSSFSSPFGLFLTVAEGAITVASSAINQDVDGQNYWKARQSYQRWGQNYWKARQSYQSRGQNYWNARQSYELRGHNSETSATANRRYESSPPKDKRIQRHAVSIRNGLLRNFAAATTSHTGFYVYWKRSCPGLPHFFWRPARTQELRSGGSG